MGEQVWNELASNAGATGGGISTYWPIPFYQTSEPVSGYVISNGGSSTFRNVPDVAAVGDPFTGVGVYSKPYGGWVNVGGTSVSSPIWAGHLSVLNAGFHYLGLKNLGYFNTLLYAVGTPFNGNGFAANDVNATATAKTAMVAWDAVSGATGYIVTLADLNAGYFYAPTQAYLTKQNKIKLTGLIPGTNSYSLIVWAISPNSFAQGAVTFATKP